MGVLLFILIVGCVFGVLGFCVVGGDPTGFVFGFAVSLVITIPAALIASAMPDTCSYHDEDYPQC